MPNQLQTNLETILNEKSTKIIPENIKKDVQIFDVVGTLESTTEINNQDKEITTNGTYTADEGYTGLGTVTVNVPQTGDVPVKLFETEQAMQADTTAKEGDLAVVYRSEVQNATVDSRFQTATFPDTVVLDSAITDYVDIRYRAVDSSVMFDCMGSLDNSRFRMDCYTESGEIRIEYRSSDGITYTRTDTTGNPVDFGTEIYYEYAEMWNDAIGKFIQVGGSTFEGLYSYQHYLSNHLVNAAKNVSGDGTFEFQQTDLKPLLDFLTDAINNNTLLSPDGLTLYTSYDGYRFLAVVNSATSYSLYSAYDKNTTSLDTVYCELKTDTSNKYEWIIKNNSGWGDKGIRVDVDTSNKTITSTYITDGTETVNTSSAVVIPLTMKDSSVMVHSLVAGNYTIKCSFVTLYKYLAAPTQLTLTKTNELLPDVIAYGKNGVVIGDNSIYDNLSQEDVLTKIYGLTKTPDLDYYTGINKQADLLLTRNIVDKYKYNTVRLKKLDNFDPDNAGMVIPLNNIKISKHNLYQFSDIIPELDLTDIANSGSMILSDDGKTLGLINLYNYNSYIIDLETHSIVKTFITRNVKSYKHKVFYATNDLTNKSSSDLNYYCYDLNTRENTIVATRPIGSVKNKYICRVNTYGRIITLLTYDRDDSTRNYPNAVNATFIDCESNQTSSMPEISWTTSGNYVGNVISCATNDGVYILVYKYKVDNPVSVIKCDLNLATSTLLRDVTLSGTNPVNDNLYTIVGIQYNNILIYRNYLSAYYINLTNKTGGYLSNMPIIDLSSNNIAMADKDDRYYPITGIDSTNSYSLILDESKFIPSGYERTRMYGTEVYMCLRMYETILTLETNSIAVVSWGNIVTNKFNVTLLTTVQDDTYDYIAINIGGTNSDTGPRFIPLGNTNLSGSIS